MSGSIGLNNISINSDGNNTKILIDGVELTGVFSYQLGCIKDNKGINILHLSMYVNEVNPVKNEVK